MSDSRRNAFSAILLSTTLLATGGTAMAQMSGSQSLSPADRSFIMMASEGNTG